MTSFLLDARAATAIATAGGVEILALVGSGCRRKLANRQGSLSDLRLLRLGQLDRQY